MSASLSKNIICDSNFLLYAGAYDPRKNIRNLLEAYSLLPSKILLKYKLIDFKKIVTGSTVLDITSKLASNI